MDMSRSTWPVRRRDWSSLSQEKTPSSSPAPKYFGRARCEDDDCEDGSRTREKRHTVKQKTSTSCIRKKYFHYEYEYSQAGAQLVQGVCVPSVLVGFQDRSG